MSVQVIDNFSYKGKKGNFERDNFDTLQAMRSYPEDGIDDGHVCFCNEDGNHYKFNHLNSVDGATGRWRLHNKSVNTLTETGEGKVLDARQGKILKDLIDAKVIEAGGVSFDTVPTKGSTNPVTSNGIKEAMDEQAESINSNMGVADYPTFSESTAYSAGDVVNYNGKLYQFTSDHAAGAWTGTDVKPYNLTKDIEERYGTYTDTPEFIRVYTDAEGKFLWGIRIDGSIEWAKGVPTPIQNALKELADKIKDLGGDKIEEVETALNEKIEALQDAIDVINASLKTLTDTFSYQDNPEFVNVVTDADGKVLFGLTAEGKPYFPKNTMYSVESNQEFLAAWLDSAGHVLFGLRTDGSTYVAKADFMDKIAKIEQMLKDGGFDDSEIREQVTALQENVDTLSSDVEAVKNQINTLDTDVESVKSEYEKIKPSIDALSGTFSIISNDEWLHAIVDADNRLLFGIRPDGTIYMPKQETYSVVSNDEWLAAWLDADNKVLFGVKADGTFWAAKHNFSAGGNYDGEIEDINNTLSSMQGTIKNLADKISDIDTSGVANTIFSVIDDAEERLAVTTDKDERVISYRDKDGVLHEKKGVDTSKYYLNGKERNFIDQTEVAGEVTKAAENGAVKLENVEGVSNHNTPNLLIASEMQKTFYDGINSFTPPNAGYEMSNPIECQAGDWFTRTGTATGMVVVTDENDKNGTRLFNADGTTLGSTFQVPTDMTWVRYIRMAAEVVGAEDGSVVICKGKVAYTEDNRGDFLTIDKLKLQNANIPKDIKFLKSPDGKYWELYVDDRHQLQIREIDPNIIVDLPAGFPLYEITGDYGDYFDTWLSFKLPFLMERNKNGVIKYYNCGDTNASYADFKKVKSKSGNIRYLKSFSVSSTSSNGEKLLTIYDEDFNIVDTNIASVFPWFDPHDYYYFDDDHVACFTNGNFTYNDARVPVDDNESSFIDVAHAKYFILYELKKINGEWKIIGQFNMYDYPKLFTDEISSYDDTEPTEVHPNTLFLDYDGNYIVNLRNNDTFIKIRRVENSDGTVTIGSKTLDYDEAIIGRVGGKYNSAYLDRKRVLEDGFAFTDVPTSLQERSTDEWDEWHWFHAHDVSYWGMKNIGGKNYPTYLLFDNNMWTDTTPTSDYGDINRRNNAENNPTSAGVGHFDENKSDSGGAYDTHTISRVVQLSIDWDNHLIKDYRIYLIQKKYSLTRGSAQMFDEGVLLINWSDQRECGLYDFNDEQTEIENHLYKNGKELWHVSNQSSFRVYGLKDE